MNNLCSQQRLELALAGKLDADEESTLNRHLDECEVCAAELERLAGGAQASGEIASMLIPDDLDDDLPPREVCSTADFVVHHLEPSDDPAVLGQLGGYDILEVIGRGGMGVVLKGYDRELKRFVAIKVLAPHLAHSALARKRFAREAQAAAAVVNLHVIAIHQVHPNGQLPFLVMPLLTGESLAQRLKARGTLELNEILRVGMQSADGLAAAHAQGLIHRDIKPANILLEKGVERAVLTDFGLARAADDVSMTRQGIIAGTPEYMSPEQARGEALDGRSDLFSLGCVLYEMATGVSPFRTESTMATLRRIVDEQPAAMDSLVPELPPWFCQIVERLLSKDPALRFASAAEVKQVLEECLSHLQQPSSVPLPSVLAKDTMKTNPYIEAFFFTLHSIGAMLLGRRIRPRDDLRRRLGLEECQSQPKLFTSFSPLRSLIVLPVFYFCFLTFIQTMLDIMNLIPTANVELQNQNSLVILRVLIYSFEAFLFGLVAAQFSVGVTSRRFLRPLMALWILVLPYLLGRKVADLVADWFGHVFSLVPTRLITNDVIGAYLTIAILSAIIYSLVIRREPSQSPQTQPQNDPPKSAA